MSPELDSLIDRFRRAQDIAVHALVHELSIPRPKSNMAWALYCCENRMFGEQVRNSIRIFPHGYGIELKFDHLTIDFDWGDNGEPDGFDGWRLWKFRTDNRLEIECSHNDVNSWLKTAYSDGELVMDSKLYYDPNRRASGS